MGADVLSILLLLIGAVFYGASRLPQNKPPATPPPPTPMDRLRAYERRLGDRDQYPDLLDREAKGLAYKRWLLAQNDQYRHNRIKAGETY